MGVHNEQKLRVKGHAIKNNKDVKPIRRILKTEAGNGFI